MDVLGPIVLVAIAAGGWVWWNIARIRCEKRARARQPYSVFNEVCR